MNSKEPTVDAPMWEKIKKSQPKSKFGPTSKGKMLRRKRTDATFNAPPWNSIPRNKSTYHNVSYINSNLRDLMNSAPLIGDQPLTKDANMANIMIPIILRKLDEQKNLRKTMNKNLTEDEMPIGIRLTPAEQAYVNTHGLRNLIDYVPKLEITTQIQMKEELSPETFDITEFEKFLDDFDKDDEDKAEEKAAEKGGEIFDLNDPKTLDTMVKLVLQNKGKIDNKEMDSFDSSNKSKRDIRGKMRTIIERINKDKTWRISVPRMTDKVITNMTDTDTMILDSHFGDVINRKKSKNDVKKKLKIRAVDDDTEEGLDE